MQARMMRILVAAFVLPLLGCNPDEILEVRDPDIVLPEALSGPQAIPTIYNGALGDFAVAYNSSTGDAQVSTAGLMTDEFFHSGTFPTRQEFERRESNTVNGTLLGVFRNLHQGRRALENAAAFIKANGGTPLSSADAARAAEMHSLAGFTYVFAAENYCSGMPYSKVEGGELLYGGPQTTSQSLDLAIQHFDSALAYAAQAASTTQERLARVGKARAQLNKAEFAGASATAAPVPTSFVYRIFHSITSARQENSLHSLQFVQRRWSLAHNEGGTGLGFRALDGVGAGTDPAQADPRIPWSRRSGATGIGFDQSSPLFDQLKYNARTAPTPLADGVEARLVEAENELRLGNTGTWLSLLNALRSTVAGLAPLADPGTPTTREDLHFKERAFWLFGTAHRLGDLRRLVRQYGRAANTVFPTGVYFKGGSYGSDQSLPIPFEEENNPQFKSAQTADCQSRTAN